jgi:glycosyltransferase involved in cell wall biosynthesis
MKIASIILTSLNGGAEQVFIDYIKIFKNLNHQNFAIVKNDAPYAHKTQLYCEKILPIKNNFGYYDLLAINKVKNFIEINQIDCVVAHAGRAIFIASKAIAKIKNRKILLVAINHSNNVKRSIGADIILSVNKKIFYKTIDAMQDPKKSFVVHNALDLTNHVENNNKINLSNKDEIIIGVIGRMHKYKGFKRAILLIDYIKKNLKSGIFSEEFCRKKFILKIAGIGEEEKNLKKLVKELSLEDDVEFLGWVAQEDFFNKIDIFLLTSKIETFGLVTLEAMKYKKPIISTNTDGSLEIIRDGVDGLIVDNNSTEDIELQFAKAIQKICEDDNFSNQMVNNAHQRLLEKFSFNSLQNNLKEIFGLG